MINTKKVVEINHRFKGLQWHDEAQALEVTVLGAGGIGSPFIRTLCKYVETINLYECDEVKDQNIGSQIYFRSHIGLPKEQALELMLPEFQKDSFTLEHHGELVAGSEVNAITIVGPDKMQPRKDAFASWKSLDDKVLFLDGRLNIEGFQCIVVKPTEESMKHYEETYLFDDADAMDLPCTTRATSHIGEMCAGVLTQQLLNFIAGGLRTVKSLSFNGILLQLTEME